MAEALDLHPRSEADLAEMIRSANGPLQIMGGGTRGFAANGRRLTSAGLSSISLYEPGALTLVAQAGTPIGEIEQTLAGENQRLAFEPMDHRTLLGTDGAPTLGGVIAANVSGPRRIAVGAARDFALGVRFVDGQGQVIKNGGRVMKNVTGYDLVKLLCGSYGTLGVLTEVALKVLPIPETESTLVLHGLSDTAAVAALAAAMGSPFDVTGAAHDPAEKQTFLRVEGFEASVGYRTAQLKKRLKETGADMDVVHASESADIWKALRDVEVFSGQAGDVWRVSCKPSDGPVLAQTAQADACLYDWAGGLLWLLVPAGADLRQRLGVLNGHATLVRADAETKSRLGAFHPEPSAVAAIAAGLRAQFDPRGILNAGLMG